MKCFLRRLAASIFRWSMVAVPVLSAAPAAGQGPSPLDLLESDHPKCFFFRSSGLESIKATTDYGEWEGKFNRMQGIMGKCLGEEISGRGQYHPAFFSAFKTDHPRQGVFLHFNGNARDPRYEREDYFPGHWIYRRATEIAEDVPAQAGDTVIRVSDASDFSLTTGRLDGRPDDIALFQVTGDGRHDWDYCEHVQLLDVDYANNTITVKRGCYGTAPLAFVADESRAAAHKVEGPWGNPNHLLWYYNFSAHCPTDSEGKTCADRLVDDVEAWFAPGGPCASFDGIEFDVAHYTTRGDTDGDGVEDNGIIGGINQYGIGTFAFAAMLRQRMGDDFVMMADGARENHQRAIGIYNGIESEGWPQFGDWELRHWSWGVNKHAFWQANGHAPALHYFNVKWHPWEGAPAPVGSPELPFSRHRLALAAAQFTGAAWGSAMLPANDPDGLPGIWDELRRGTDEVPGWLGAPEGPAVSMAAQSADLLDGQGSGAALADMISGPVTAEAGPEGVVITADPGQSDIRFFLDPVTITPGNDIVVIATFKGDPRAGYPAGMPRGGECQLPCEGEATQRTWINGTFFTSKFYFRNATGGDAYQAAFGGGNPAPGWRYQWNQNGALGAAAGYVDLEWNSAGNKYAASATVFPSPNEIGGYVSLSASGGHTGPGIDQGLSEDRYAIAAHTVQEGGTYDLTGSWIRMSNTKGEGNGSLVAVYVNDSLQYSEAFGPHGSATAEGDFDGSLGDLAAGDTVYVAVGPNGHAYQDGFTDFDFAVVPRSGPGRAAVRFVVEGGEPVTLQSVTIHEAPDTFYPLIENGLVIANASHGSAAFDLETIAPGRSYRRIQGVSMQDPGTNNGQPVSGTVTLGDRDALFLVEEGKPYEPYPKWIASYSMPNPSAMLPLADPDGGSCVNLAEYALGGDPTDPMDDAAIAPVPATSSGGRLNFTFCIPEPAPADLTFEVLASPDLESWETIATKTGNQAWTGPAGVLLEEDDGGSVRVTIEDTQLMDASSPRFICLKVSLL